MNQISYDDFLKVALRAGKIIAVEPFARTRKPAYKIKADFGTTIGVLQTSAQITHLYSKETLIGKYIIGCVNLPPKNIAGFLSEFLLVGFATENNQISLISPDHAIPLGNPLI